MGPGLTRKKRIGKSSQNSPKHVLSFWVSIPCVFCLYTLLQVINHNDLTVPSMSVMGFQKKGLGRGWMAVVALVSSCPLQLLFSAVASKIASIWK